MTKFPPQFWLVPTKRPICFQESFPGVICQVFSRNLTSWKWAEHTQATKKNLLLSMKYWLFNRDPYIMVYHNPTIPT